MAKVAQAEEGRGLWSSRRHRAYKPSASLHALGNRFALVTFRCSEVPERIPLGAWLLLMYCHFYSVVMVIKLHCFLCSGPLAGLALRGHVLPPEEAVCIFKVKVEELGTVSSLAEVPSHLCSQTLAGFPRALLCCAWTWPDTPF